MRCELCQRFVENITWHHFIPRSRHTNKKVKLSHSIAELKTTTPLCQPCHGQIHSVITEKEMEREYNSIEKLKKHIEIVKFLNWIKNKPPEYTVQHKETKNEH